MYIYIYTVNQCRSCLSKGNYQFTECLFSNVCFPCIFCFPMIVRFKKNVFLHLGVNDSRAPRQQQILWEVHWLFLVELEMFCLRKRQIPPATIQQFLRGNKGKAWIFWVKLRFFLQEQNNNKKNKKNKNSNKIGVMF